MGVKVRHGGTRVARVQEGGAGAGVGQHDEWWIDGEVGAASWDRTRSKHGAVTLYGGSPVIEKETEKRIQKPHASYLPDAPVAATGRCHPESG